ncbi:signal recognition particle-docking protein FtsY [Candidatus Hepatoplasma crinochetorum]|uniref:Signal recognition particle receptor FtsY n=1 Tax=Candidatus Hepatoplasma crinochetorum Av TaxID=1427984 RepID=W8GNH9_9MOLU|nr:signal recognition particle-docking protein FtsY [Candidatus Hepatoplasma crinochetorum]AHK22581.1 signal recognition particle-docking protein FtsY [Candidatus Hepatoplasma crinochetorum Av]BDV03164.1 MAG: signal recognition particle receptor FtsY [Candidatus Hepatoplasma crinochetorum]
MAIFKFLKKKKQDQVLEKIKESKQDQIEEKYQKALKKSNQSFAFRLKKLAARKVKIDQEYFDELQNILISADIGAIYANNLILKLKDHIKVNKIKNGNEINQFIIDYLFDSYLKNDKKKKDQNILNLNLNDKLNIILVIGVNGTGKTTSIAKLANYLQKDHKKVLLAAADTFRAGAVEQLKIWGDRLKINVVSPDKVGQDPASVVYKAILKGQEEKADVLIIDTAGRLQNKANLMQELQKIDNVIFKLLKIKAQEKLLVLDATIGQNGINQASEFNKLLNLSGIILTKTDSSAKGGIIIAIKDVFNIPVKFIGMGEKITDFAEFDLNQYLIALLSDLLEDE